MMAKVIENPEPIFMLSVPEIVDFFPLPEHHVFPFPVKERSECLGAVSPSKAGSEEETDPLGDSVGFAAEREGV